MDHHFDHIHTIFLFLDVFSWIFSPWIGPAPGYKTAIAASGREVYVVDEELVEQMNRSSSAGAAGDAPASAAVSDNSNFHQQQQEKQRILPSHWIPSQAPEAAPRKAEAPVRSTHCPMGHHSLRLKQLIPVQWDTVMEEEEGGKVCVCVCARSCVWSFPVLLPFLILLFLCFFFALGRTEETRGGVQMLRSMWRHLQ